MSTYFAVRGTRADVFQENILECVSKYVYAVVYEHKLVFGLPLFIFGKMCHSEVLRRYIIYVYEQRHKYG